MLILIFLRWMTQSISIWILYNHRDTSTPLFSCMDSEIQVKAFSIYSVNGKSTNWLRSLVKWSFQQLQKELYHVIMEMSWIVGLISIPWRNQRITLWSRLGKNTTRMSLMKLQTYYWGSSKWKRNYSLTKTHPEYLSEDFLKVVWSHWQLFLSTLVQSA